MERMDMNATQYLVNGNVHVQPARFETRAEADLFARPGDNITVLDYVDGALVKLNGEPISEILERIDFGMDEYMALHPHLKIGTCETVRSAEHERHENFVDSQI